MIIRVKVRVRTIGLMLYRVGGRLRVIEDRACVVRVRVLFRTSEG